MSSTSVLRRRRTRMAPITEVAAQAMRYPMTGCQPSASARSVSATSPDAAQREQDLDEVAALKQTEGGPIIVHGSATLNHGLSDAGLIDRYHLLVFPLLLGAGKRLFSSTDKATQKLKLVESEAYSNGIQKNVFDVVR